MIRRPTRREILKLAGLSTTAAFAPVGFSAGCATAPPRQRRVGQENRPRNIIFMVSDGMSGGVLPLADSFSRIARKSDDAAQSRGTYWQDLMCHPAAAHGLTETFSLDALVTDSAAAASAWGSGTRVNNRSLNYLPDGRELVPLGQLVKESGRRLGLVTTVTVTHATPAGFAAAQESRGDEQSLALQYLDRVDVLLGGGRRFFDPAQRQDQRDLLADFAASGYTVWDHRDQLLQGPTPQRVLGLFADRYLPYTVDQRQSAALQAAVPTLAELTRAAIQSLDTGPSGFFLMVEGGRVDHAAHANDAASLLWDQLAFDDALGEALTFAHGRDDTLIIVTTDHGNSNPGLNGRKDLRGIDQHFPHLAEFTASFATQFNQMLKAADPVNAEVVHAVVAEHTGLDIPSAHAEALASLLREEASEELNYQQANPGGGLGQIVGNHIGIGWTGVTHTADHAVLTALGPGATAFQGFHRNTDAFGCITDLWDIDYRNPSAKPADVWRVATTRAAPQHDEWSWV